MFRKRIITPRLELFVLFHSNVHTGAYTGGNGLTISRLLASTQCLVKHVEQPREELNRIAYVGWAPNRKKEHAQCKLGLF